MKPMIDYRREYKVPIHGCYAEVVRPGLIRQGGREGNKRGQEEEETRKGRADLASLGIFQMAQNWRPYSSRSEREA